MKFRQWLNKEEREINRLGDFIEDNGLVLFFKKGAEYFGADEDSRVVFARMLDGEEGEDADFPAVNLSKLIGGEPTTHLFSPADAKKIKVVDQDDAVAAVKKSPVKVVSIRMIKLVAPCRKKEK